jgi:hypothetical protein
LECHFVYQVAIVVYYQIIGAICNAPATAHQGREISRKVQESRMAGMHVTMWIACRMPDWLYFGDFDLVSKQIEMAGARSKCFGNLDARIEMD